MSSYELLDFVAQHDFIRAVRSGESPTTFYAVPDDPALATDFTPTPISGNPLVESPRKRRKLSEVLEPPTSALSRSDSSRDADPLSTSFSSHESPPTDNCFYDQLGQPPGTTSSVVGPVRAPSLRWPPNLVEKIGALRRRLRRRLASLYKAADCVTPSLEPVDAADQELVSDPGRLSPHPVDALYAYLLHHRILLRHPNATSVAPMDVGAGRWSGADQAALYTYVFEEAVRRFSLNFIVSDVKKANRVVVQPRKPEDWQRIASRLGRSVGAVKARFAATHATVEQEIVRHYVLRHINS